MAAQPKKATAEQRAAPPAPVISEETDEPSRQWNPAWFWVMLVVGAVLLIGSAAVAISHSMPGWEQRIFHKVNGMHAPQWVVSQVAKQLSNAVWGMVGLSFLLLLVPKYRLRAWQYAVAAGAAYSADFIIEHIVNRARPEILLHGDVVLRATQGGPGFPSGHMTTLTALGLTLWLFVKWPWRILIVGLLAAEAWARVFLGVHAPLDVVGGLGVGLAAVAVLHLLPLRLRHLLRLV